MATTAPKAKQQSNKSSTELSYFKRPTNILANYPFLTIIGLLSALVIFGVVGYMMIEGWSFTDALYMTVITMTTIGYGEVNELSVKGRTFTIILIIVGVITASYAVTATVELFTSQEFLERIRHRRRRRILEKLNHHTIICGFGRLGRNLAKELRALDAPCVVIDIRDEAIQECHNWGVPAVLGNAADENALRQAGIDQAKSLVAAANSDAENVFIVLTAKSIKSELKIISRCNAETSIPKLEKAGADSVLSPYAITGHRIAQMLTRPNVVSFLDGILEVGEHQMRIEEFIISADSALVNQTLREARLKVAVLAVDHPGQMVATHPTADTRLLPGTALIAMGVPEELEKLAEMVAG